MRTRQNIWPPERDAKLAELWDKGLTTREIEAEMLREFQVIVTKNAIVGRAHRLKLPSRPSPIKRASARPSKPRAVKPARQEVPVAGGGRSPGQRHLMARLETAPGDQIPGSRFLGVSSLTSAPVVALNGGAGVLFEDLRPEHCRWPLWNDEALRLHPGDGVGGAAVARVENTAGGGLRAEKFRYCGCAKIAGRPYCEGHVARAYVNLKPRAESIGFNIFEGGDNRKTVFGAGVR